MKRNADQISGSTAPGAIKRSTSDGDGLEESEPSSLMILTSQNKSLTLEMLSYKRTIAEGRKELDLMRRKSREMEALVSLIQRAWSQLDIDSSMLLDSLGDSEIEVPDAGTSELLHRLLYAGAAYTNLEATSSENVPKLDVDQWSSNEEIEQEKNKLENIINENIHSMNAQFGGTIAENLSAHAGFTLSLLERLCNAINESSNKDAIQNTEKVQSIIQMKEFHSEKLMLNDRIAKLTSELVNVQSKLKICENEKLRVTRKLDKAVVAAKEYEHFKSIVGSPGKPSMPPVEGQPPIEGGVVAEGGLSASDAATLANNNSAMEKELKRQIAVLERQLIESETAKSKVEMTLTERLARPLSQTETQVADMRRSMEELRQQCKQRVSALILEGDALQTKVGDLEIALQQVEQVSKTRMSELLAITEKEIASVRSQHDSLQAKFCAAQADLAVTHQLKAQLAECQTIESLRAGEMKILQNKLKMISESHEILQDNLTKSRERELILQQQLDERASTENAENAENVAKTSSETSSQIADLQRELDDARSNINDLILEIEGVSDEEMKARTQSERIVNQISEYQSMQRVALEENMRLQDQIDAIKTRSGEMESKMELMKSVMLQQESLLNQIRSSEQVLRAECHGMKKSSHEVEGTRHIEEQKLLEAKQKLIDSEHGVKSALKRNEELQSRCDELSSKCESERKQRLEAQRESAKLSAAKKATKANSSSSAAGASNVALSSEDADMLEMTLGMLRCSVCKDRFKSVAITRCFHLFCKECIDENLRNRQRKCPACGEKFGQDDVTNIFFTH